jgi:TPP-dependent pyruvate/acetoin dehydrogenase alpha subunit
MNDLYDLMILSYFGKDEVKKYVYVELMTIKTLLIGKGVFTQEEFDETRAKVESQIEQEIRDSIDAMRKENPKEAAVIDTFTKMFEKKSH